MTLPDQNTPEHTRSVHDSPHDDMRGSEPPAEGGPPPDWLKQIVGGALYFEYPSHVPDLQTILDKQVVPAAEKIWAALRARDPEAPAHERVLAEGAEQTYVPPRPNEDTP